MPSLNCYECPHWDSETMDCYLDCEDAYECCYYGNPYMDDEEGEGKMKYHVHINDITYTYKNPYDMYDLLVSIAGQCRAEEACSWAELAHYEQTYEDRSFTISISEEDEIEADGRAIII